MKFSFLKTFKKWKHRLQKHLIAAMPEEIRLKMYRLMLNLSYEALNKYEVKVADTQEELEQAFALLHDQYVRSGYMRAASSGKRFTFYHTLPSTTVIVVKSQGRVIGTCSLFLNSHSELPAEKIYSIEHLKQADQRVAEISSLAVEASFERKRGEINMPLGTFALLYCANVLYADSAVITCNPTWEDFYKGIYGFKDLERNEKSISYDFVNGAPAVGLYVDLKSLKRDLYKSYSDVKDKNKNLYKYMQEAEKLQEPYNSEDSYFTFYRPSMKVEALRYFFEEHPEFYLELSTGERQILYNYFQDFQSIANLLMGPGIKTKRKHQRFRVRPEAVRHDGNGSILGKSFYLREVSIEGFSCDLSGVFLEGTEFFLSVRVGQFYIANLRAKVININEGFMCCKVLSADEHWYSFVDAQYQSISDRKESSITRMNMLHRQKLKQV